MDLDLFIFILYTYFFILSRYVEMCMGIRMCRSVVFRWPQRLQVSRQQHPNTIHSGTHSHSRTHTQIPAPPPGEKAEHQFQIFSRATYDVFIVVAVCAHISYRFSSSYFANWYMRALPHDLSICPNLIPKLKKKFPLIFVI